LANVRYTSHSTYILKILPEDNITYSSFVESCKADPCVILASCSLSTLCIAMSMTCAPTDFVLLETGLMVVRAKWNTWIEEARTEVAVWEAPSPNRLGLTHNGALLHDEAPIHNRDFRNGGSVHDDAPQFCGIWSPLRTTPVRDLQLIDTPPSVQLLERRNVVSDAAMVRPNRLVLEAVRKNENIGNKETLEVLERKLEEGLFEHIISEEMMMEGIKREVAVEDDVRFESGAEVVFKPGERGDCSEIPRMGGTIANVLAVREENSRFGKLCDGISLGKDSLSKKTPGRRGWPPGRLHSLTISRRPFSHCN
jgi:hypothetical protein